MQVFVELSSKLDQAADALLTRWTGVKMSLNHFAVRGLGLVIYKLEKLIKVQMLVP